MKQLSLLFILASSFFASAQYSLVWSDEFDGTSIDYSKWSHDIGQGVWGWGNNELQNYTNQNYNVGGGYLEIFAKNEGSNYSSTRMKTQGLK